jgi:transcriptional regulator with XRE-family HTH domain
MGTSPHPEAALLRRARQARGLSIPAAAEAAGISPQRWGQIERSEGKEAPPETIARMAHAVGVTAVRLAEHRPNAADILDELELQAAAGTDAFEAKVKEAMARLPAEERSVVEDLYAELVETEERQERKRRSLERLISVFVHRPKTDGTEDTRGSVATNGDLAEGT